MENLSTLEIAKGLIGFNTENNLKDTREISKYIGGILEDNSIMYRFIRDKHRIYILSEIGEGKGKKLVLYGHSDVVTAGDHKKWASNPYIPVVKGDKLYGRGSADMKGGLAAEISAFIELAQDQERLNGKVQLLVSPDEEDFDDDRILPRIIKMSKATACIMGEPHNDDIITGEKGELAYNIRAVGKSSHGSTPAAGLDAGIMLDTFIHELRDKIEEFNKDITSKRTKLNEFMRHSSVSISDEFQLSGATRDKFIESNPAGTITINVGYFQAGHNYNIVPDEAEAKIAMLVPYGFDYSTIVDFIGKNAKRYDGAIVAKMTTGSNASLTESANPLVGAISEAYTEVKHKNPNLVFDTGCTDAVFYRTHNIPSVIYGPGYFSNAHVYDEFVSIKEMEASREIYRKAALNYLA